LLAWWLNKKQKVCSHIVPSLLVCFCCHKLNLAWGSEKWFFVLLCCLFVCFVVLSVCLFVCCVVSTSLKGSHFNRTVCLGYRFSFVRLSLWRWTKNCENDGLYYFHNSSCDLLTTRVYSSPIFKYSKLPNHYVAKFQILHSHTSNCQSWIDFFKYVSINVANI
jgi:hypothetical protein